VLNCPDVSLPIAPSMAFSSFARSQYPTVINYPNIVRACSLDLIHVNLRNMRADALKSCMRKDRRRSCLAGGYECIAIDRHTRYERHEWSLENTGRSERSRFKRYSMPA
jgi:hypothetical protein